ncbi:protein kinase [candidate division CSSED10-310 bacterium]|uniref:Protein kinase n=1 Tax=candidate division CSSED10-310 bacterium TaxID=2855610 RepID=A0ABV6Z296_UNCC1
MIGKTLNHYQIREQLGKGGMGEVYIAEDTKLMRRVALKILPPEMAEDADRVKRFEREVKTLAALNHPNIVTIYSVEKANGFHFFTMELVKGKSLAHLIPSQGVSLNNLFELMIPLTAAIKAAHEQGVTHRDLKPENIILSDEGRLKVLDFGLAKYEVAVPDSLPQSQLGTDSLTQAGKIFGTISYMSPEQAMGKLVDQRSDIFALGILLYEMATGRHPFQAGTNIETLTAIIRDIPRPVTDVNPVLPVQLAQITDRCLNKEPHHRYQSSSDLLLELEVMKEKFDSGELSTMADVSPVSWWQKSIRPVTRVWFFLALMVVLSSAIFLGYHFLTSEKSPPGIGPTGRPTIAVMSFEDHTGSEEFHWLSSGLPSMLLTGLAQTPHLDVVSNQRVHEILKQIGRQESGAVEKSDVAEVARRAGAGAVVVGDIYKAGSEIRIDVQVEDVASGHIITAESVRGEDVFLLVDQLTDRIRKSLSLTGVPDSGIAEVTTNSIKAYRLYNEGLQARTNYRWWDALKLFQEAVALDPSFAMAHVELANIAQEFLKKSELREKYRRNALDNLKRLPKRQQLLVQGFYSQKHSHGPYAILSPQERKQTEQFLLDFIEQYPDMEDTYNRLAYIYMVEFGQPDRALKVLEQGMEQLPYSGPLLNLYGYYLQYLGRYEETFKALNVYRDLAQDEPNPYDSLGEAYLNTGQPLKAIENYSQAIQLDPTFFNSYLGRSYAYLMLGKLKEAAVESENAGQILINQGAGSDEMAQSISAVILSYYGRYQEAEKRIARCLTSSQAFSRHKKAHTKPAQLTAKHTWFYLIWSLIEIEQENWDGARQKIDQAREASQKDTNQVRLSSLPVLTEFLAGMVAVRSGNLDEARQILSVLKSTYNAQYQWEKFWFHLLEGHLELTVGNLDAAQEAFIRSKPDFQIYFAPTRAENTFDHNLPFKDGIARVLIARGNLQAAIEEYRKLITPSIKSKWTAILLPQYVLELARLLAEAGEKDAARKEYQRFLELWQGADPDSPRLKEALQFVSP